MRGGPILLAGLFLFHLGTTAALDDVVFSNEVSNDVVELGMPYEISVRQSSQCDREACTQCQTCNLSVMHVERKKCDDEVRFLQQYQSKAEKDPSVLSPTQFCILHACLPRLRKQRCNIIPSSQRRQPLNALNSMIASKKKELQREEVLRRTSEMDASKVRPYHNQYMTKKVLIDKRLAQALKARAHNNKLIEYLDTFQYRQVLQEVTRIKYENRDLQKHYNFWVNKNKTLSHAVTLSIGALKQERNRLYDEMQQYEADAELINVLRNSRNSKEMQVKLIKELKMGLNVQVDTARMVNAQSTQEAIFMEKARSEIEMLLTQILIGIRDGKVDVKCGKSALSSVVGHVFTS